MADLARLVTVLEAQTAKYSADLDKANRKLDKFSKDARKSLGSLDAAAAKVTASIRSLGAGFSVFAAANIIRGAIALGDALDKAAIKAGVSGRVMSELAHAAKMADVDIGGLSNALRFMQTNLSKAETGSAEVKEALAAIGTTLREVKALTPDKQFEFLAGRINALIDPADKARASVALFGKAGADLLPLFSDGAEGIRKAREEAVKLGIALSDNQIKILAEADDAVKRLSQSWRGFSATITTWVAPKLTQLLNELTVLKRVYFGSGSIGENLRGLQDEMAGERESARFGVIQRGAQDAPPGFVDTKGAEEAAKKATEAARKAAEAEKRLNAEFMSGIRDAMGGAYGQIDRDYDDEADRHLQHFIEPAIDNLGKLSDAARTAYDEVSIYADEAARNMQTAFADFLFDPFENGVKGMLKNFVDVMRRITAEIAAAAIFDSKSKGGLGLADWLSGALGGLFGDAIVPSGPKVLPGGALTPFSGPRAAGGPVDAGYSYLVGERGPELFTPRAAGHITPNHALGGGIVINQNVDARGASIDAIRLLPVAMKQASDDAVARIQDQVRRGRL